MTVTYNCKRNVCMYTLHFHFLKTEYLVKVSLTWIISATFISWSSISFDMISMQSIFYACTISQVVVKTWAKYGRRGVRSDLARLWSTDTFSPHMHLERPSCLMWIIFYTFLNSICFERQRLEVPNPILSEWYKIMAMVSHSRAPLG